MATTGGSIGNGCKLAYSANSPVSWTAVEDLLDVGFPKIVRDKIESTVHSPGGFHRSFGGLKDVPDIPIKCLAELDPTLAPGQDGLRTLNASGATVWWRLEIPISRDLSTTQFRAVEWQASVKDFGWTPPIAGRKELDATLQFDGTSVTIYAPGSSAIS